MDEYRAFTRAGAGEPHRVWVIPLFTVEELEGAGVRLALYPLSVFRAMSQAALKVYQAIRTQGTQSGVTDLMQSGTRLCDVLGYQA